MRRAGQREDVCKGFLFFRVERHALESVARLDIEDALGIEAQNLGVFFERVGENRQGVHGERALTQRAVHHCREFGLDVVALGNVLQALVGFGYITQADRAERDHQGQHDDKADPDADPHPQMLSVLLHRYSSLYIFELGD